MTDAWISQMNMLLHSLEEIDEARIRIREVESRILDFTKGKEASLEKEGIKESSDISLIDEVLRFIEDVELSVNRLDIRLSAIERLVKKE
ncbi:MAG: hypothetical protein ACFFD3_01305 [Candidatus Thorarchaeota archaeon]